MNIYLTHLLPALGTIVLLYLQMKRYEKEIKVLSSQVLEHERKKAKTDKSRLPLESARQFLTKAIVRRG